LRQYPRYSGDDGTKYVSGQTPFDLASITLVVVSDATATHLVRQPGDIFREDGSGDIGDIPF